MGIERPTIDSFLDELARRDATLASVLRRAETAARIVAREVRLALAAGEEPAGLREFVERACAESLSVAPSVAEVRTSGGRVLESRRGGTLRVVVDAVRTRPGRPPSSALGVVAGGGLAASASLLHGARALLAVEVGAEIVLFEEDPAGGPFVALGHASPPRRRRAARSGAPGRRRLLRVA
jgi:ParB-like chromosome segregation protein Spo0J